MVEKYNNMTRTEKLVLELFVSRITYSFTIREVSRLIGKDLKIVYTSIKKLMEKGFFVMDRHEHLKLNYKKNIGELDYIEHLRKEKFFAKHPSIRAAVGDFLSRTKRSFFVLLIFGSYAEGRPRKDSDVDILAILPEEDKDEVFERELYAALSPYTLKFHISVISQESFINVLTRRDEINVANETLNRHVILFGGESYYRLLGERDVG